MPNENQTKLDNQSMSNVNVNKIFI